MEQLWSWLPLAAPETQRGMGFPPGMVTFASAWQPEATEHEAAQLGVQIAVQFPVDLRG